MLWSPGYIGNEVDKMNNFDDIKKWTAEYTHDWFINKCIPYAMNENLKKSETILQGYLKEMKLNTRQSNYLQINQLYHIERINNHKKYLNHYLLMRKREVCFWISSQQIISDRK